MLPELTSGARMSEYVCDLEYLFSTMNVGSYGPTKPHLWLVVKIPPRKWEERRSTSERKRRTHTYDDLVKLLIELALEIENDSHMETFLKRHLAKGASPSPDCGESTGGKTPTNSNKGRGKGGSNLRAMNEAKPAGVPPLFYCKPVNDNGGPCHAPDCDHRSGCMLQLKRQQHTKDGKRLNHQDHSRCTITGGFCRKRCHYEDECQIQKCESDKLKRQEADRQKNQPLPKSPKNGDKGCKGGGKRGWQGWNPQPEPPEALVSARYFSFSRHC